jgi:hypothetical protein
MAKLTKSQRLFLERQNVPLSSVFDATGLSTSEYKQAMSDLGMLVAYGVTACKAANHTMRTRAGHCLECRPAGLGFLTRFDSPGQVYVAHSLSTKYVKVGTSNEATGRVRGLCSYQYGGATDWELVFALDVEQAGRIEFDAHRRLARHRVSSTYIKTGYVIECQELFRCSVNLAVKAVKDSLKSID